MYSLYTIQIETARIRAARGAPRRPRAARTRYGGRYAVARLRLAFCNARPTRADRDSGSTAVGRSQPGDTRAAGIGHTRGGIARRSPLLYAYLVAPTGTMLRATAALMLLLLAAATNGSHAGLRASQGLGRDTKCLDPPPPLRDPSLTAAAAKAGAAPSHLKYLGMDGAVGDDRALGYPGTPWVSLGFMAPGTAWNLTRLRHQKANGVAMMANMHGFTTGSGCMYNYTCWHKGFIGPNATAGGNPN
eukprot:SAG31_NODE_548_length_14222_cov_10.926574_10_plen_246_part_00